MGCGTCCKKLEMGEGGGGKVGSNASWRSSWWGTAPSTMSCGSAAALLEVLSRCGSAPELPSYGEMGEEGTLQEQLLREGN